MSESLSFGTRLSAWRRRRGLSQLDLAGVADSSQRHVSFLESGRTAPSREMVLRLAQALDLPLRQQNAMLLAAGFAPMWRESDLAAPELTQVQAALAFMLAQQEPFPAVVVDRRWNILDANLGAAKLVGFLAELGDPAPPEGRPNLADALMAPGGMRHALTNWAEVAAYFLRGVQADALADGTAETQALLARISAYPGAPALAHGPAADEAHGPVLTMVFEKAGTRLALFTAIATLGTPQDVTLQEIRIESFFPADEPTAAWFRA